MIKEARWSGWVWVGECFFWYRPTRVVPDQRPLNGRCCCCFLSLAFVFSIFFLFSQIIKCVQYFTSLCCFHIILTFNRKSVCLKACQACMFSSPNGIHDASGFFALARFWTNFSGRKDGLMVSSVICDNYHLCSFDIVAVSNRRWTRTGRLDICLVNVLLL